MGRPRKQTADYFPHFVAAGRTKFVLEDGWGNDGYAFWFKLLELLCKSDGHYYNCKENGNKRYLTAITKVDEDKADAVLEALADMGKIDRELWEQAQVIWCQNLVDNLADMYSKRTDGIPKKPSIEEFSGIKGEPDGETAEETDRTGEQPEPSGEQAPAPPAPQPRRKKPSSLSKKQEERFNRFWHVYPRKENIGAAERAWAKIDPDEELTAKIIEAVQATKRLDSRFREKQYTPHPASWLNGREWLNEYDSTVQKGGSDNGTGRSDFGQSSGFRPSAGFKRADPEIEG